MSRQFADLRRGGEGARGLGKKEGVVFSRGGGTDIPMHTLVLTTIIYLTKFISHLGVN